MVSPMRRTYNPLISAPIADAGQNSLAKWLAQGKILEVAFLVLSAKSDGYLRPGKRKEYLIPAVP